MTKEISINVQLNKKEPGSLFGTKKPEQKEESNKDKAGSTTKSKETIQRFDPASKAKLELADSGAVQPRAWERVYH